MASGRQYRGLIYQNVIFIKITLAFKHPKSRQSEKKTLNKGLGDSNIMGLSH